MRCSASWRLIRDLTCKRNLIKRSTRRMRWSMDPPGLRNVSLSTGWSMIRPFHSLPRDISKSVTFGCKSISSEASNMACSPLPQPSLSSQSFADSPLFAVSVARWSRWLTSSTGATSGAMKTGGAAPRKSSSPTRSTRALATRWPWSEATSLEAKSEPPYSKKSDTYYKKRITSI